MSYKLQKQTRNCCHTAELGNISPLSHLSHDNHIALQHMRAELRLAHILFSATSRDNERSPWELPWSNTIWFVWRTTPYKKTVKKPTTVQEDGTHLIIRVSTVSTNDTNNSSIMLALDQWRARGCYCSEHAYFSEDLLVLETFIASVVFFWNRTFTPSSFFFGWDTE